MIFKCGYSVWLDFKKVAVSFQVEERQKTTRKSNCCALDTCCNFLLLTHILKDISNNTDRIKHTHTHTLSRCIFKPFHNLTNVENYNQINWALPGFRYYLWLQFRAVAILYSKAEPFSKLQSHIKIKDFQHLYKLCGGSFVTDLVRAVMLS